jgi:3-oxoadipate enol-lactonase
VTEAPVRASRVGAASLVVRGAAMSVVDRGSRPPLLLIHGFPLDHAAWRAQIAAFAPSRRVIAPDLVGFGSSAPHGRATLDEHADDLAALLDALGVARAVAVGLSMGGCIALALYRRHRGRLAGLVLAASRAGADSETSRAGRYQMAIAAAEHGTAVVADALLPRLLAPDAPAARLDEVRAMMCRQGAAGVVSALKAMAARASAVPWLGAIDLPTLVVVGDADEVIPPAESGHLASAIPGAQLVVIPGAGHLVNIEAPGAFNAALRAFLDAIEPA